MFVIRRVRVTKSREARRVDSIVAEIGGLGEAPRDLTEHSRIEFNEPRTPDKALPIEQPHAVATPPIGAATMRPSAREFRSRDPPVV